MGEFAIGQSPGRLEDLRLLRGRGQFVEDVAYADAAHGFVLRSPHAMPLFASSMPGPPWRRPACWRC